jgi:TonB-dependent receptor
MLIKPISLLRPITFGGALLFGSMLFGSALSATGIPQATPALQELSATGSPQAANSTTSSHATADSLAVGPSVIRNYGDMTVQEALLRQAGVYTNAFGALFLRGLPVSTSGVTVNGLRLGASETGGRGVDVAALAVAPFRAVRFVETPTPDMDGDFLTGVIVLESTDFTLESGRTLNIRAGGGANPYFFRLSGPASRGSITYGDRYGDHISVRAHIGYHNDTRGSEGVQTRFARHNFGNGLVDVLEQVSPYVQTTARENLSGVLDVVYQPDAHRKVYLSAFVSNDQREVNRYHDAWNANGSWSSPTLTSGGRSSYEQAAGLQQTSRYQHVLQVGGEELVEGFGLRYNLGWSRSVTDNQSYLFPFLIAGRNLDIDMTVRDRPVMLVNNFNLQADGSIDRQFMTAQPFERLVEDHTDNQFSARVDVNRSFAGLTLKAGVSARLATQFSTYSDASLQFVRILRLNRFNFLPERNFEILDNDYDLPWLLNTGDARRFLESQRPQFVRNENTFRSRSEIWNYDLTRRVVAGYVMGTSRITDTMELTAGLRVETVSGDAIGRKATFSHSGAFIASVDTSASASSTDVLPYLAVSFTPHASTRLSLSYNRSAQRPDYNMLVPFEFSSVQQMLLFRGNPELESVYADNLNLRVGIGYGSGAIQAGIFGSRMANFVAITEQIVTGGPNNGWGIRRYENTGDEVVILGFDLRAEQRLSFMDGFVRYFGLMASYTFTDAAYSLGSRNEDVRLPGHTPHVLNAGLDFTRGRFYLQALYHWSAENLLALAEVAITAPSVSGSEPVFMDTYQNGWSDLSVSGSFRISPQFFFWIDANNLLVNEYVSYQHTLSAYPVQRMKRSGPNFQMGIRYTM